MIKLIFFDELSLVTDTQWEYLMARVEAEAMKDKQPPICSMCKNDDLSMMTIEHKDKTTKIYCEVCGKTTLIDERKNDSSKSN